MYKKFKAEIKKHPNNALNYYYKYIDPNKW